jgi:hypothetical protein
VISRIHQKLGTAGFVISIVALVAALCGGAYAAGGGLSGKQKKEVTKIAKKYAGKPGTPGAQGPKGDAGSNGVNGTNGSNGVNGKSVTVTEIEPEEFACNELGGAEVKQEGANSGVAVCNGAEGSPWTAGGVLPKGATETGIWSASGLEGAEVYVPISFPIQLSAPISAGPKLHLVPAGGAAPCTGTAAEPTAPEGQLCVYEYRLEGAEFGGFWNSSHLTAGVNKTGGYILLEGVTSSSKAFGTWAVTGF